MNKKVQQALEKMLKSNNPESVAKAKLVQQMSQKNPAVLELIDRLILPEENKSYKTAPKKLQNKQQTKELPSHQQREQPRKLSQPAPQLNLFLKKL